MNLQKLYTPLKVIALPTLYAIVLRLFFGIKSWGELFNVMSLSFLFCLPTIVGAMTVYFSPIEKTRKLAYRILVPWVPIFIFLIVTLFVALEGWACWLMVLPLFLIAASLGGLLGGWLKLRKKDNKTYLSILMLAPICLSPIEQWMGANSQTYKAYTFIDIHAPADSIWNQVVRVSEIQASQDKGWLTRTLGFPRPVKAELNYKGVGASREAIFTNGLVFHETVLEYIEGKKMVFTIKAYPSEIPSTTLDEHVVIGGEYFDVLTGTYELEQLNTTTCRLHLYSHFSMKTTFNSYASAWATWIMKDIQNNILQIEKERAELN